MRKLPIILALAVASAFMAVSCGTSGPAQDDPVSRFIRETRQRSPENALLGIGTSVHSNRAMARNIAEARARAEIVRQLDVVVRNMVTDYMAGSEAEQRALLSFQESITQTLASSQLRGAVIQDELMINGEQITIVILSTDNIANEIMTASQSAAALAPHMANAQWALDRMNQALTDQNSQPPVLRNHD
ncbi:MAG: hypothetical protein FWE09_01315 [Treponema sp.]|nr:hypothetical protein [Treponema sp.]